jgi:hypothetical protein
MIRRTFLMALVGGLLAAGALSLAPGASGGGLLANTVTVAVTGQGTVVANLPGIDCPGDCSQAYLVGAHVELTAQPAPGWKVKAWSGDCLRRLRTRSDLCPVDVGGGDREVAVAFERITLIEPTADLSVGVPGSGQGSVVAPNAIACPGDCSQEYPLGLFGSDPDVVTLTAIASAGSVFSGWSGACAGTAPTCQVTMSADRSVTATFESRQLVPSVQLSVAVGGNGQGTVSSPGAIACPGDCDQAYKQSDAVKVVLTAIPAQGSAFAGWAGACAGLAPTCELTMSESRSATAAFQQVAAQPGGSAGAGGPGGRCTIVGTPGDDVLTGTPGDDVICGLGGNDTLIGRGGADVLRGGAGADLLLGGGSHDRLKGGAGADVIRGGAGNDHLTGGASGDRLYGGAGVDVLVARDGRVDTVNGGAGFDRARIDRAADEPAAVETLF